MKLITEQIESVEFLIEDNGSGKTHFIEGVFLQSEIKNRNGRVYPMNVLEKEVQRYTESFISKDRALGELGHPEGPTVNLDRVSHKIVSLKREGTNFIGKAKILETPMGKIAKNLLDEGVKLGVSSRGVGSISERNGASYVRDSFHQYLSVCSTLKSYLKKRVFHLNMMTTTTEGQGGSFLNMKPREFLFVLLWVLGI